MLDHPNVVKYFSSYIFKDDMWLITEFMEGGTFTEATQAYRFQVSLSILNLLVSD